FDLPPDLFTVDRSDSPNALPAANEHEQADFRRQVADDVVALLGVGEGEARAAGLTRHLSCQDACFVTDGDSSAVVRHAISADMVGSPGSPGGFRRRARIGILRPGGQPRPAASCAYDRASDWRSMSADIWSAARS
ncbi:MAG TPA: hypothetical protein VGS06_24675, partial [Streptosporangiaceae bacterium]|nr:hypothetical protein [Streptosporangiaceae bacterium]